MNFFSEIDNLSTEIKSSLVRENELNLLIAKCKSFAQSYFPIDNKIFQLLNEISTEPKGPYFPEMYKKEKEEALKVCKQSLLYFLKASNEEFNRLKSDKQSNEKNKMEAIFNNLSFLLLESDIKPEVFLSTLNIAVDISKEGREGKPVGTAFVIGDSENVMNNSKQLILNPFEGHPQEKRMVTNEDLKGTIKDLAQIDGVFVVQGNGLMEAAGRFLMADARNINLPKGLGTKHNSVAAMTMVTKAIGIVVSQSGGGITVIKRGKIEEKI